MKKILMSLLVVLLLHNNTTYAISNKLVKVWSKKNAPQSSPDFVLKVTDNCILIYNRIQKQFQYLNIINGAEIWDRNCDINIYSYKTFINMDTDISIIDDKIIIRSTGLCCFSIKNGMQVWNISDIDFFSKATLINDNIIAITSKKITKYT